MSDIIKPRTDVVTIYPGDYLGRIRHLEQQAEAAKDAVDGDLPRLNDEIPEYYQLAQQHDDLVREAEEQATHIRVQALPRKVWKALAAAHPPRVLNDEGTVSKADAAADAAAGVNIDSFRDALVYGGTVEINGQEKSYRTIVEPELTGDDIDALSDIDFDRVYFTAFHLNRVPGADPKASLVSRLTPKNDETSS